MEKLNQLYEGKAKKVFATDDPEVLLVSYKDDATAFNGVKRGTIAGKGAIREGYDADLVLLDDDISVKRTIIGGKTFWKA